MEVSTSSVGLKSSVYHSFFTEYQLVDKTVPLVVEILKVSFADPSVSPLRNHRIPRIRREYAGGYCYSHKVRAKYFRLAISISLENTTP